MEENTGKCLVLKLTAEPAPADGSAPDKARDVTVSSHLWAPERGSLQATAGRGGRGVLELPPLPVQPGHTESSPCWPRKLLPGLCPETISPEQGPPWSSAGDREGSPTQVERDALGRGSHISPVMGIQIKNYNTPKNTHHPEPEPENVRSWGKWSTECCVGETEASG